MGHPRFTARMYVDYYARYRNIRIEDIGVSRTVILSWGQAVVESLAAILGSVRQENWFYDAGHIVYPLYSTSIGDQGVSVVQCPEGAPATVMMMEELVACGARVFFAIGWAGGIQPSVPIGSLLLPISCVCHEGTSRHYVEDGHSYGPDPALASLLLDSARAEDVNVTVGTVWTTDAPYRELVDTIEVLQADGVVGVDMETSAMYALGRVLDVKVCNLLVISDELWGTWRPAFRSTVVSTATLKAQAIVRRCVSTLHQRVHPTPLW